ncbi:apolipoprotein A1/A4/E family protein [Argonema antarcticum]|uniref:apolipoprotein A1/A4/E family protein n=1 Tax=Argonema antarcticum TaxID=2942763 RepID=UPI002010D0C6|nr:apolipoprotein A1/A4/E family protein [Argonema antarcticum]MCL1475809.1 apolipoprotein A1/A4/E family protein [Argonema antarcticum A004/B2]
MTEITKEEMRERLGNIDQIRDIIFGPQLREYNNRFDKLESDISLVQQEMRDRIDQVRTVLSTEIRSAVDGLEKKLKTLNLTSQEEINDVRQQLDRVNKKFSSSIEALDQTVDNQNSSIREELSQSRNKLQEDVRALRGQVFDELERRFSMMREAKVSKDDMAEILFELGMRLKGNEFVPQLKEVADTDNVYSDVRLLKQSKIWE